MLFPFELLGLFLIFVATKAKRNVAGLLLDYLTFERNYSPRTVGEYQDDLRAFESFYKEVDAALSWDTVDADVVRNWMVKMMIMM